MECTCSIDISDDWGGAWKLTETKVRTARKEHECEECGRIIAPGEKYEHFKGMADDGERWYKQKTCVDCLSLRKAFFQSYFYQTLWEDWWGAMDACGWEVPEKCLSQLTPAAREKACESIESAWEEWEDD